MPVPSPTIARAWLHALFAATLQHGRRRHFLNYQIYLRMTFKSVVADRRSFGEKHLFCPSFPLCVAGDLLGLVQVPAVPGSIPVWHRTS